MTERITDE